MRRLAVAALCLALAGSLPAFAGKKGRVAKLSDRELYELGMKAIENGNYYKGRSILEEIVNRGNQDHELAALVQLAIADSYYGKRGLLNLADAMSRYSTFLTFYPMHEKADYAQYRLALCHLHQVYAPDRDQRETYTALAEFQKVLTLYPDSPYVDLAGEKINDCYELLANHDYRVGMFYHRRKAYLGAVDRFMGILDQFPRYSRKDRVYYYLSDSLIRTHRVEEADVYIRKLAETYPDSDFVKKADGLRERIEEDS
jgi:outer membrane protein assembly factor BamD